MPQLQEVPGFKSGFCLYVRISSLSLCGKCWTSLKSALWFWQRRITSYSRQIPGTHPSWFQFQRGSHPVLAHGDPSSSRLSQALLWVQCSSKCGPRTLPLHKRFVMILWWGACSRKEQPSFLQQPYLIADGYQQFTDWLLRVSLL